MGNILVYDAVTDKRFDMPNYNVIPGDDKDPKRVNKIDASIKDVQYIDDPRMNKSNAKRRANKTNIRMQLNYFLSVNPNINITYQ